MDPGLGTEEDCNPEMISNSGKKKKKFPRISFVSLDKGSGEE